MPPDSPNGDQAAWDGAQSDNTPDSLPGGHSDPAADGKPAGADSSTAATPGDTKPASVYDAVLAAIGSTGDDDADEEGGESPPPASAEGKGSTESGDGKAGEAGGERSDAPPPVKTAETRVRELLAERKNILPKAVQFDQLGHWMRSQGVTQQRFTEFLSAAALASTDPAQTREWLLRKAAEIEHELGISDLPPDIQDRLDRGQIDEDTARELALVRKGNNVRNERARQLAEQQAVAQQIAYEQQMSTARANAIGMAVTHAERALEGNDPDYPRIRKYVAARVKELLDQSIPATPEEAVKQFRDAVAEVKADFAAQNGRRPPISHLDRGDRGASALPPPKTALEAAQRALAASR